MLAKTHPKHPSKTEQKTNPKPGQRCHLPQREQAEIKADHTGGKMQGGRLCELDINRLCGRHQLPAKPGQQRNYPPAGSSGLESNDTCRHDHQNGQDPIAPGNRPRAENEFPESLGRFHQPFKNHRISKLEQRQTQPCARQHGKYFRPSAAADRSGMGPCRHQKFCSVGYTCCPQKSVHNFNFKRPTSKASAS